MAQPPAHPILIFADGASSGNPGPGGYGTIVVLPEGHVTELGGGDPQTTNNRMELLGVIQGLGIVRDRPEPVAVYTDSTYVIRGITQWCWGWSKRGWKTAEGTDVKNADLWKKLIGLVADRKRGSDRKDSSGQISWHYVRGHSGVPGNERVDEIAVAYAARRRPSLYDGPLLQYDVAIHDIPEDTELPDLRDPKERAEKHKAYSYLSLVNGVTRRHAQWKDCEAQVKGRPGAKFKKATSPEQERQILEEWGVDPASVLSD